MGIVLILPICDLYAQVTKSIHLQLESYLLFFLTSHLSQPTKREQFALLPTNPQPRHFLKMVLLCQPQGHRKSQLIQENQHIVCIHGDHMIVVSYYSCLSKRGLKLYLHGHQYCGKYQ